MDFGEEFLEFSEVAGLGLVQNAVRDHPAHWGGPVCGPIGYSEVSGSGGWKYHKPPATG